GRIYSSTTKQSGNSDCVGRTGNQSTKEQTTEILTREKIFESLTVRKKPASIEELVTEPNVTAIPVTRRRVGLIKMTKAARASRLGSAAFAINNAEQFSVSQQLTNRSG